MKGKEGHGVANFATFVSNILLYLSIANENGCNNGHNKGMDVIKYTMKW